LYRRRLPEAAERDLIGAWVSASTDTAAEGGDLLAWARSLRGERLWALEDCRQLTRTVERTLLAAGEQLVRVPPKLMAPRRRARRERGKSDPIDALAVARSAPREPRLVTRGRSSSGCAGTCTTAAATANSTAPSTAITQAASIHPLAPTSSAKHAEGKSRCEAVRCLKRQLARVVFNTLKASPV
jgi:hypothetical protein